MPDHLVAEIIDGELYTRRRGRRCRRPSRPGGLSADLINPFDRGPGGPGGWWILVEPELHLAQDVLVPDLAGWRRARMPDLPRGAFLELAPDWVCETELAVD